MDIIQKVLNRPEFECFPPVLVDIGAAGYSEKIWNRITRYSICIAFDADERGIKSVRDMAHLYKRLHIYNAVLIPDKDSRTDFYLTRYPCCSSMLRPLNEKLTDWAFARHFEIEKAVSLKTTNLSAILQELNLDRVDWFKTDSQGIDLRLFLSLGGPIIDKVMVADFEPGIIDAYEGEDKLWSVMAYMDKKCFWMSDSTIYGSQRIRADIFNKFNRVEKIFIAKFLKISPGWAEISYINSFRGDFTKRDFLLGWVFAFIKKQYGFALEIAVDGHKRFNDDIFMDLKKDTILAMRFSYFKNFLKNFRLW